MPQFWVSVFRLASQPLEFRPSQLSNPVSQVPTWQRPDAHVGAVLWASMQTLPQLPQLFGSLVTLPQPEPVSGVVVPESSIDIVIAASVVLGGPASCALIAPV